MAFLVDDYACDALVPVGMDAGAGRPELTIEYRRGPGRVRGGRFTPSGAVLLPVSGPEGDRGGDACHDDERAQQGLGEAAA